MNDAILNLGKKMVSFIKIFVVANETSNSTNEFADNSKMVRMNPMFWSQNETADNSNADKSGCG